MAGEGIAPVTPRHSGIPNCVVELKVSGVRTQEWGTHAAFHPSTPSPGDPTMSIVVLLTLAVGLANLVLGYSVAACLGYAPPGLSAAWQALIADPPPEDL